jgi:hypothetical protein
MKVYLVDWIYEYEPGTTVGIYSTLEKAKAAKPDWLNEWERNEYSDEGWVTGGNLFITVCEIDVPL